ncbi:MAG: hypothetical protein HYZ15_01140 [Sphingobacteriales bacterium]|nr:hypothetical protein [Sphingobacteriales bacterium]
MKRVSLLLLAAFFALPGFAQKNAPILITPGVGVNNIKLGMTQKQVLALLKGDPRGYSYENQLEAFASDGTRIDSVMQFVLGFDTCIRYDGNLPEKMPVFGLYFLKDKLNFITVTSYSAPEEQIRLVKLKNGLKFHDSMEDCGKKLAKSDYLNLGYGDYSGDHYYYTLGLEMVYDEGVLTAIGIYPVTRDFKARIAAKSEELQKEAEPYAP